MCEMCLRSFDAPSSHSARPFRLHEHWFNPYQFCTTICWTKFDFIFFQLTFVRHWHFLHILLCVCISHWMLCIFTTLKQIVSFEKIYTIFSVGSVVTVFLASNRICILTCPREGSEVMCVCVCEVQTRENDKYSPHHHSHVHKDYISKTHGNRRVCA